MILRVNKKDSYSAFVRLMTKTNVLDVSKETRKSLSDEPSPKQEPKSNNLASGKSIKEPKQVIIPANALNKIRTLQKRETIIQNRRRMCEKQTLNSYLGVCVDVGQINRAFNLLVKYICPKPNSKADVEHYNIVLKGWAKLNSIPQIVETRMLMIRNNIEPNAETFAYILLGYSRSPTSQKSNLKTLLREMKSKNIDPKLLFQSTYLNVNERKSIKNLLKTFGLQYDDTFCQQPITYNCNLMDHLDQLKPVLYNFSGDANLSKLESWAEHQRMIEWKSSITIKSVANVKESPESLERYTKAWQKFYDMWRKALTKSLDESLETLQTQCAITDKVHLYPYLCSVDKNMIIHMMLDEIEANASCSSYSLSTNSLHSQLGTKVMTRYFRTKAISDGSHHEKQRIYNEYLTEYCRNPESMGKMNSREYIQRKAFETKNYAIYKDKIDPVEQWPHHIVAAVGRFLYGIILREVKFDPSVTQNPKRDIKMNNLVHAFYTAYFQIDGTHKIKEEFRSHQDFEKFHQKSCASRLKFDYSYLPTSSPPMPWMSHSFGGYLTNKSDLVRISNPFAEQIVTITQNFDSQKLYPSLDSLNAIGLCPWIVNKEILDIVIDLFRSGGDAELTVPLDESRMEGIAPVLKEGASKADRILFSKEKKKYEQKRREMYSLWRDCLYRLSIANHFRDRIFWFPHNMDFRGRTYPIPPHFNHLGSDLARSLLLFAKGQPLGENGLDWLKIHLINLVGSMKSSSLDERLDYANSILHSEVLDSADNPWDGRKWWTNNDNPWQVLACCKEIAKAIRSRDFKQYISHFPVHQDGSCNGLQHYAALGRDPGGGLAVNLVPCDKPQDVYSKVVDIVEDMRKKDVEKGVKLAEMLEGFIQRKVIKQTVMTTVYGVTRYGARQQIARQLAAKDYPEKEIWRAAQYLSSKTFESIGQMFNKSRLIQDWLIDCAFIIASKYRQPVSWETPLGFPVIQPYTQPSAPMANRLLSSSICIDAPLLYNDPISRLNASKQKTAFPPNYIHSLDSSHMMLTSLYCERQGITFVSVHDCYWTHPNTVDIMNRICRQQFVALHSEPLLQNLSDQFMQKFGDYDDTTTESSKTNNKNTNNNNTNQIHKKKLRNLFSVNQTKPVDKGSRSSSITSSGYDDRLVDEDLELLMDGEVKELRDTLTNFKLDEGQTQKSLQPLIKMYHCSRQAAQNRTKTTFKEVPQTGKLNLNAVLESTYFFS